MNVTDVTKVYFKGTAKEKSKLKQDKALINPGLEKSKIIVERKALMKEFDPR